LGTAQWSPPIVPIEQCTLAGFTQLIERIKDSLPLFGILLTPESFDYRLGIFLEKCRAMEASMVNATYKYETNAFSLMTSKELAPYAMAIPPTSTYAPPTTIREKRQAISLPTTVDWRTKNVLTPVKNQGQCGCCWAFAATGALEPAIAMKTKTAPVSLSEQELVDCSAQECQGGYMDQAYSHIQQKKGICRTTNYPGYSAKRNTCARTSSSIISANVVSWVWVADDELSLQKAVAQRPVTSALVVKSSLHTYKGGIYYEPTCNEAPGEVNHGVVVVGYGTENGEDYWLIKNSWGPTWGDNGYFKLARNRGNNCLIAKYPLYPTV
jgi:cathepsin L